jgi:hypothetical protein
MSLLPFDYEALFGRLAPEPVPDDGANPDSRHIRATFAPASTPERETPRKSGVHPASADSPDGLPELWLCTDDEKKNFERRGIRNGSIYTFAGDVKVRVRFA